MTAVAARVLPADPRERAAMIASRCRAITGPQHQIVTCWRCLADLDIRDARPDGGQDWTCTNYDACDERAAMQAEDERNERVFGGTP